MNNQKYLEALVYNLVYDLGTKSNQKRKRRQTDSKQKTLRNCVNAQNQFTT